MTLADLDLVVQDDAEAEEEWGALSALLDPLLTAETAEELWVELCLHDIGEASADGFDGEMALRRLHGDGQPDAVTTALVLLTSWRHRRCTARLVRRLAESGVLDESELDELAAALLDGDEFGLAVPAQWLGPWLTVTVDAPDDGGEGVEAASDGGACGGEGNEDACPGDGCDGEWMESSKVALPPRRIAPPLRRWAAARIVSRDTSRLAAVVERTEALERRHAAAAMAGLLDAADRLAAEDASALIERGVPWPDKTVRKLALTALAGYGDVARARALATVDADASIRAFAPRLVERAAGSEPSGPPTLF
jgi:hypothetical protein